MATRFYKLPIHEISSSKRSFGVSPSARPGYDSEQEIVDPRDIKRKKGCVLTIIFFRARADSMRQTMENSFSAALGQVSADRHGMLGIKRRAADREEQTSNRRENRLDQEAERQAERDRAEAEYPEQHLRDQRSRYALQAIKDDVSFVCPTLLAAGDNKNLLERPYPRGSSRRDLEAVAAEIERVRKRADREEARGNTERADALHKQADSMEDSLAKDGAQVREDLREQRLTLKQKRMELREKLEI